MYEKLLQQEVFEEVFHTESDFTDFLKELDTQTEWIRAQDFETKICLGNPAIASLFTICSTGNQWKNACDNEKLVAIVHNNAYVVNELTTPLSLNERAGAKCLLTQHYFEECKEKYAEIVNDGISEFGKKLLFLVRGSQILAVHTQKYNTLSQELIFDTIKEHMHTNFNTGKFLTASYNHDCTSATYSICEGDDEFLEDYAAAWKASGLSERTLSKTNPVIEFSTSDTGRYPLSMRPVLNIGRTCYSVGPAIDMKHNGKTSLSDIDKQIDLCYAAMQKGINTIIDLLGIKVLNPEACFVRAARSSGATKSAKECCRLAYNDYRDALSLNPGADVTAFQVYRGICDMQMYPEFEKLSPQSKLSLKEAFNRALNLDWEQMDKPGDTEI